MLSGCGTTARAGPVFLGGVFLFGGAGFGGFGFVGALGGPPVEGRIPPPRGAFCDDIAAAAATTSLLGSFFPENATTAITMPTIPSGMTATTAPRTSGPLDDFLGLARLLERGPLRLERAPERGDDGRSTGSLGVTCVTAGRGVSAAGACGTIGAAPVLLTTVAAPAPPACSERR